MDNAPVGGNTFTTPACFPVRGEDSFTDADFTPLGTHVPEVGGGWTALLDGGAEIRNNNVKKGSAAGDALWNINGSLCDETYWVRLQVKLRDTAATTCAGPAGRIQDENNLYWAKLCGDGVLRLELISGGTPTVLGTYTVPSFDPYTMYNIKLRLGNANKKVILDGTEVINSSDNTIAGTGVAGLRLTDNSSRGDDFKAQDF